MTILQGREISQRLEGEGDQDFKSCGLDVKEVLRDIDYILSDNDGLNNQLVVEATNVPEEYNIMKIFAYKIVVSDDLRDKFNFRVVDAIASNEKVLLNYDGRSREGAHINIVLCDMSELKAVMGDQNQRDAINIYIARG